MDTVIITGFVPAQALNADFLVNRRKGRQKRRHNGNWAERPYKFIDINCFGNKVVIRRLIIFELKQLLLSTNDNRLVILCIREVRPGAFICVYSCVRRLCLCVA